MHLKGMKKRGEDKIDMVIEMLKDLKTKVLNIGEKQEECR